jgi:hypothetical protein
VLESALGGVAKSQAQFVKHYIALATRIARSKQLTQLTKDSMEAPRECSAYHADYGKWFIGPSLMRVMCIC